MLPRAALFVVVLILPIVAQAQAYKCRTPSGKVVISNQGCYDGAHLEKITTAAPMTLERQLQAADVNNRMLSQLEGVAQEKTAYNQQLQQLQRQQGTQSATDGRSQAGQNADNCVSRVESISGLSQRQKANAIASCHGTALAQNGPDVKRTDDCVSKVDGLRLSGRQKADAIAQCHGAPPAPEPQRAAPQPIEAPPPLAVIKNTNGNTSTDQMGNRYSTTAGKTVRSDGKRCYQQGNAMYCD